MKLKTRFQKLVLLLLAAASSALPQTMQAASDTWIQQFNSTTLAPYYWNDITNWLSGTQFPNGIDEVATATPDILIGSKQFINLTQPITVGTLQVGDVPNSSPVVGMTIESTNNSPLIFDVTSGNATLEKDTVGSTQQDTINARIELNDSLDIKMPWSSTGSGLVLRGVISGPGGINLINRDIVSGLRTTTHLYIENNTNTFTGPFGLANGRVRYHADVLSGQPSPLGASTTAVTVGNAASLGGSSGLDGREAAILRLDAAGDTNNYAFTRDLDFSQTTGTSDEMGSRLMFYFYGNEAGGTNSNNLTFGGVVTLASQGRKVYFHTQRAGMVMYFTNAINPGTNFPVGPGDVFWGDGGPRTPPLNDGPEGGNYRFSDMNRIYSSPQSLQAGSIIIEGSVGSVGSPSPIGTETVRMNALGGGNISTVNAQMGRRDVFLATPGASFARPLTLAGGEPSSYNGGSAFNLFNVYKLGGLNTSGTVTFSGDVSSADQNLGANTPNVITVGNNLALIQATGGTANFTGVISDTPTNITVTRLTINQARNHPNLDAVAPIGVPDPGVANALVDTATSGTVILSAANTYEGGTEILGGKLLVNNSTGSGTGSGAVIVQSNAALGGSGTIDGPVTFNEGSHAVFTVGTTTTMTNSLSIATSGLIPDVHLNLPANLGAGNYTLATYNTVGSSGAFNSTPVVDSGSFAAGVTGTNIVTSGGTVVLQVTGGASTPPNFSPAGITVSGGGAVSLTATGALGTSYRLWANTNVAATPITNTWTLLTNGTITVSPFTIIDQAATNYSQRFYLFSNP
jgi:autotransporter-associated beta strand protein